MAETFKPLNNDRYVAVGYANRSEGGAKLAYPILDLASGKVTLPEVTLGPDLPGTPSLVHYDAQKGSGGLFSGYGGGAKEYKYAHWDLASGKIDWSASVGVISPQNTVRPIGVDPAGRYFYFLQESSPTKDLSQWVHADKATVGRLDLQSRQIDWRHDVSLPGHSGTTDGGLSVQASPDFSKFAITEYTASPAGGMQGYVVDVATGEPIANASVQAFVQEEARHPPRFAAGAPATTDRDGRFALPAVQGRQVLLHAKARLDGRRRASPQLGVVRRALGRLVRRATRARHRSGFVGARRPCARHGRTAHEPGW
jgi:hypothetical protein